MPSRNAEMPRSRPHLSVNGRNGPSPTHPGARVSPRFRPVTSPVARPAIRRRRPAGEADASPHLDVEAPRGRSCEPLLRKRAPQLRFPGDAQHPPGVRRFSSPTLDAVSARTDAMRPLLLNVNQAAQVLAISRSKLYELIAAGRLPLVHIDGCARLSLASLEKFVSELS